MVGSATGGYDFEKGAAYGSREALAIVAAAVAGLRSQGRNEEASVIKGPVDMAPVKGKP